MYMNWAEVGGRKANEMGATAAITMLGQKATKEQKRMKLQLYSERCLMVGGCHGERMKLDGEGELGENFNFCFLFSTSVSHSHDIEPCHLCIHLLRYKIQFLTSSSKYGADI